MTLPVVVTTYFPPGEEGERRSEVALATVASWRAWIHASLALIVADDHSDPRTFERFVAAVQPEVVSTVRRASGVGASLNRGFLLAFQMADYALYAVDDWMLTGPLVIRPWLEVFDLMPDIGCLRLGVPHPNLRGSVIHVPGPSQRWLLALEPYGYAVAQRPAIWHRRFFTEHGWWPEDCSAIDCERAYAERWNAKPVSRIALAMLHPWEPQESVELSAVNPLERAQ